VAQLVARRVWDAEAGGSSPLTPTTGSCYYLGIVQFFLIVAIIIQGLAIVAFCLWLSLRVFGLKASRAMLAKIIGLEAVFLVLVSLIGHIVGGALELLLLIGGAILWAKLLKRFVPHKYSPRQAIGSYITGYILALIISLAAAILGITFFARSYKIDGNSMAPALKANQRVIVYKFEKKPGNKAIIVYNTSSGKQALGRVHGVPGQSVAIPAGYVDVNGQFQEMNYFTLSKDQYYVTSDNITYNIPPRVISTDNIVGTVGPKL
jgi:signal peptidase I